MGDYTKGFLSGLSVDISIAAIIISTFAYFIKSGG